MSCKARLEVFLAWRGAGRGEGCKKGGEHRLVAGTAARWRADTVWQNQIYSFGASSVCGGVGGRQVDFEMGCGRGEPWVAEPWFKTEGHFAGALYYRNE